MARFRLSLALQTVCNAIGSLGIQGIALIFLSPSEYGKFAVFFLIYGLGVSFGLSVVSEPWAKNPPLQRASWQAYSQVLVLLSAISAIPAVLFGAMTGSLGSTIAFASGVFLSVLRSGLRYYSVAQNERRHIEYPDLASGLLAVAVSLLLFDLLPSYEAVGIAWAVSMLISVALSKPVRISTSAKLFRWTSQHSRSIRPLLVDSTLMDVGTVVASMFVAPLLGLSGFGIYRSVFSTTLPVRLILNPIRPLVVKRGHVWYRRVSFLGASIGAAATIGLALWLLLSLIPLMDFLEDSVLRELSLFAPLVAVFVGSTFVGNMFYMVARIHSSPRTLLTFRGISVLTSLILPLGGISLAGLSGAIWGLTAHSVVSAIVIICFVRSARA